MPQLQIPYRREIPNPRFETWCLSYIHYQKICLLQRGVSWGHVDFVSLKFSNQSHCLQLLFIAISQGLLTAITFLLASLPLVCLRPPSLVILQTAANTIFPHLVLPLVLFGSMELSPESMAFGSSFNGSSQLLPTDSPAFQAPMNGCYIHLFIHLPAPFTYHVL